MTKSDAFFQTLFNAFSSIKPEDVQALCPDDDAKRLQDRDETEKDLSHFFFSPEKWLNAYDPSWYVKTFEKVPRNLRPLFLSVVPSRIKKVVADSDDVKSVQYPEAVQHFLLSYLYRFWTEEAVTPKEQLKKSECSVLLDCTKREIKQIIDLLSMHDLVDDMRQVVDKRVLELLSKLLKKEQLYYLKLCLRQKTKPHAPTYSLRELLKNPQTFSSELHAIGIKRFATALCGEPSDHIRHILYKLDKDEAMTIKEEIKDSAWPHATKLRQLEIMQILQFLKMGKKR